jgi:hypothetical protein
VAESTPQITSAAEEHGAYFAGKIYKRSFIYSPDIHMPVLARIGRLFFRGIPPVFPCSTG